MASAEFQFDTRIRRFHVPIVTQQHRLRHLRSIAARNIVLNNNEDLSEIELFYTLHQKPDTQAFYTSEVINENLSPSWKHFEPNAFPENVNISSPYITVKLWDSKNNKLLLEWIVFFSGLSFLGIQIPKEGKNFKPNTLLFGMLEGFYGYSNCQHHPLSSDTKETSSKESLDFDVASIHSSYALTTLGRIKTIERAIKQTQATASRRRKNIENRLQEAEKLHQILAKREFLKIKISMLKLEMKYEQSVLMSLEKNVSRKEQEFADMESDLNKRNEGLRKSREKLTETGKELWEMKETLLKTEANLNYRRKELITELCTVYPIVEFPDRRGFSINSVHLPNSENILNHEEKMISVALGYVCHVVLMISHFINVPLRYSMHFGGSRSYITDHISSALPVKSREFPLFNKGSNKRLFEYGVYLLNKNISQLRILFGLNTKELSATLPNLYSLIDFKLSTTSIPTVLFKNTIISHDSSEEKCKKQAQNGLKNINGDFGRSTPLTSDFLKKEIEGMMPSNLCSEETCVLPRKSITENTLSCSLDKGLNEIQVIEKTHQRSSKAEKQRSHKLTLQMRKIGKTSSSYPNLNSSLVSINSDVVLPSESPNFQPLKMWIGESSHTNSEDETFYDTNDDTGVISKDSCFYIGSKAIGDVKSEVKDPLFEMEKAMLDQQDFGEDLALRTEQLASRSSSFQMQRLTNSYSDSEQMHI